MNILVVVSAVFMAFDDGTIPAKSRQPLELRHDYQP